MPCLYERAATRKNTEHWWSSFHDDYDLYMHYVSAGAMGKAYGMEQLGVWNKIVAPSGATTRSTRFGG